MSACMYRDLEHFCGTFVTSVEGTRYCLCIDERMPFSLPSDMRWCHAGGFSACVRASRQVRRNEGARARAQVYTGDYILSIIPHDQEHASSPLPLFFAHNPAVSIDCGGGMSVLYLRIDLAFMILPREHAVLPIHMCWVYVGMVAGGINASE